MKAGRMTAAEDDQVAELAERGWTAGRIALKLDRHKGTINFAMTRLGLKAPADRQFKYVRNGRLVRSFSADEDAFILALRAQDYPTTRIAVLVTKRTGHARTAATIGIRLKMLANRDEMALAQGPTPSHSVADTKLATRAAGSP